MGIKHFFTWFKNNFSNNITFFNSAPENISIDVFLIDMNGVFHNAAQKVFEYGSFAKPKSFLSTRNRQQPKTINQVYFEVCKIIDKLVALVKPKKQLVLAIDGVAPFSKQNQQRQRRFRSEEMSVFDPNCITPGTEFMDQLSAYIHRHIKKQQWNIEVIFSNEKVPGEGEHKLINYIRKHGSETNTYCINALDADLFMLSLGTFKENFYLLRDDISFFSTTDYMYVDIGKTRKDLQTIYLKWNENVDGKYDEKLVIYDFILLCFMCGNDFLPNIPSIEIMENGLEKLIQVYKSMGDHLTTIEGSINFTNLQRLFNYLAEYESELLNSRLHSKDTFPDDLLKASATDVCTVDFDKYRQMYYEVKCKATPKEMCQKYIEGMQWVLFYYIKEIKTWNWSYPYSYSPFCFDLAKTEGITEITFTFTPPVLPFLQLLCVLPPKSHALLPEPLSALITSSTSPIKKFYPDTFEIDLAGKHKRWEGIVLLPSLDFKQVFEQYKKIEKRLDSKRNIHGKNFIYKQGKIYSIDF